ncbi:MAG: chemotaxis protein CheX [Planctomycetaceae bacterium]|jgi:chemotaxis protein CheX|nr:chemotaxis protein CheX [Planctomycetaceae bacterium]
MSSSAAETITVDYLNPVIESLEKTFEISCSMQIARTGLQLMENNQALQPISGIIGVSGRAVGTIVLSLGTDVAKYAAKMMLMLDEMPPEVDDDVMDVVGELTNMVTGGAKAKLEEYHLSMSLPNVLCGDNCRLHFPSNCRPIAIPFKCEWGELALQVGFTFHKK